MKNPYTYAGLAVIGLALSACGGTSTPPPVSQLQGGSGASITYSSGPDTATLVPDGGSAVIMPEVTDTANLTVYGANPTSGVVPYNTYVIALSPDSQSGQAALFYASPALGNVSGYQVSRVSAGSMPTGGSATFTGGYVAQLISPTGIAIGTIQGTAILDANFASATISGEISGRVSTPGSVPFDDITLAAGALSSDGMFAGTATGGMETGTGIVTGNGAYQGFVLGPGSDDLVGGLSIEHSLGGSTSIEYGVFYGQ